MRFSPNHKCGDPNRVSTRARFFLATRPMSAIGKLGSYASLLAGLRQRDFPLKMALYLRRHLFRLPSSGSLLQLCNYWIRRGRSHGAISFAVAEGFLPALTFSPRRTQSSAPLLHFCPQREAILHREFPRFCLQPRYRRYRKCAAAHSRYLGGEQGHCGRSERWDLCAGCFHFTLYQSPKILY